MGKHKNNREGDNPEDSLEEIAKDTPLQKPPVIENQGEGNSEQGEGKQNDIRDVADDQDTGETLSIEDVARRQDLEVGSERERVSLKDAPLVSSQTELTQNVFRLTSEITVLISTMQDLQGSIEELAELQEEEDLG